MNPLVPLLAMVPRLSMASCSLMPMPLSVMVSVLASLSKRRGLRVRAVSYRRRLFSASKRSLSQASDALEISSRPPPSPPHLIRSRIFKLSHHPLP